MEFTQLALPLYKKVIFVDWHGVMSTSTCWNSIIHNKKHPLYESLYPAYYNLFMAETEKDKLDSWMKGDLRSIDIVNDFNIFTSDKRFRNVSKYLTNKLETDCENMILNKSIIEILKYYSDKAYIILATDNMDYFYNSSLKCKRKRRTLARVEDDSSFYFVSYFDYILCSSQIGFLKSENPDKFFGHWLEQHNLLFENAILIDDSKRNCTKFEEIGGNAFKIDNWDDYKLLDNYLSLWIED